MAVASKRTVTVKYDGNGSQVRYELTRDLSLKGHIESLCEQLRAPGPRDKYALLMEHSMQYITEQDVGSELWTPPTNAILKLKLIPREEARQALAELREPRTAKKALFGLKNQLRDLSFAKEFLALQGHVFVLEQVRTAQASTLAYALQALEGSLVYGYGFKELTPELQRHLVSLIDSTNVLVARGAVEVLAQLARSSQFGYAVADLLAAHAQATRTAPYAQLLRLLEQTDVHMKQAALALVNALLASAPDARERAQLHEQLCALGLLPVLKRQAGIEDPEFSKQLLVHLSLITASLRQDRARAYDKQNQEHEQLLLLLWKNTFPDEELTARVSEQWKRIGFQGTDPATDFRGMGLLGLKNLLYFSAVHRDRWRRLIRDSIARGNRDYPVAVAGISISQLVYELLRIQEIEAGASSPSNTASMPVPLPAVTSSSSSAAATAAAGSGSSASGAAGSSGSVVPVSMQMLLLDHVHAFEEVYCMVFDLLDRLWDEMNATYMEYPKVFGQLRRICTDALANQPTSLTALEALLSNASSSASSSASALASAFRDAASSSAASAGLLLSSAGGSGSSGATLARSASMWTGSSGSGSGAGLQRFRQASFSAGMTAAGTNVGLSLSAATVSSATSASAAAMTMGVLTEADELAASVGGGGALQKMKAKVWNEALEFVKAHTLSLLREGAAFRDARQLLAPTPGGQALGKKGLASSSASVATSAAGGSRIFVRLAENLSELHWGQVAADAGEVPQELPNALKLSDLAQVQTGLACPVFAKARKPDEQQAQLCLALMARDGQAALELCASNRQDLVRWSDGLRLLLGQKMENPETLEDLRTFADVEIELRQLEHEGIEFPSPLEPPPPVPDPPASFDFAYQDQAELLAAPAVLSTLSRDLSRSTANALTTRLGPPPSSAPPLPPSSSSSSSSSSGTPPSASLLPSTSPRNHPSPIASTLSNTPTAAATVASAPAATPSTSTTTTTSTAAAAASSPPPTPVTGSSPSSATTRPSLAQSLPSPHTHAAGDAPSVLATALARNPSPRGLAAGGSRVTRPGVPTPSTAATASSISTSPPGAGVPKLPLQTDGSSVPAGATSPAASPGSSPFLSRAGGGASILGAAAAPVVKVRSHSCSLSAQSQRMLIRTQVPTKVLPPSQMVTSPKGGAPMVWRSASSSSFSVSSAPPKVPAPAQTK
jgi:hypothetical protein